MTPLNLEINMKKTRHFLFAMFAILACSQLFIGCNSKEKEVASQQLEVSIVIRGKAIEGLETIYDGTQDLEFYINGRSVGKGDSGPKDLLSELKNVKGIAVVRTIVPPRIVAGSGKAVVMDSHDLSQYIKDGTTANMIRLELSRIRGETGQPSAN